MKLSFEEALLLTDAHQNITEGNLECDQLITAMNAGFNTIDTIEKYDVNAEYDENTLLDIDRMIIEHKLKLGIQDEDMLSVSEEDLLGRSYADKDNNNNTPTSKADTFNRLNQLYVSTVTYIVAAYNKLVSFIRKIITSLTTNVFGYKSRVMELNELFKRRSSGAINFTLDTAETLLVFRRFATLINAYDGIGDVSDLLDIIAIESIDLLQPKMVVKSGNMLLRLSDDYFKLGENYDSIKDLLDDELNHLGAHGGKVDKYFLKLLKEDDPSYKGTNICLMYFNSKCSGITSDDDSVFLSDLTNIVLPSDQVTTLSATLNLQKLQSLSSVLVKFVDHYDLFKKEADNCVKVSDSIIKNIMSKGVKNVGNGDSNSAEIKKALKIIKQYTNIVPRIANANIVNYVNQLKNTYWLLSLCSDKMDKEK